VIEQVCHAKHRREGGPPSDSAGRFNPDRHDHMVRIGPEGGWGKGTSRKLSNPADNMEVIYEQMFPSIMASLRRASSDVIRDTSLARQGKQPEAGRGERQEDSDSEQAGAEIYLIPVLLRSI